MTCTLRANRLQLGVRCRRQIHTLKFDVPRSRLLQSQDQPPDRRLAAAEFADKAKRFARINIEADIIDRADDPASKPQSPRGDEMLGQVPHRKQRHRSCFAVSWTPNLLRPR